MLHAHRDDTRLHGEVHVLANLENRSLIAATIAIVRRRKDRDHVLVVAPVVTLRLRSHTSTTSIAN